MEEMGGVVCKINTRSRSYSIQSWYSSRIPVQNKQFSHQHLDGIKSAIVSVFRVLHSDKSPLAPHERVQQFFQAKKRIDPKLPNYIKEMYSLIPIIDMIRSWRPTKGLRLKKLQEKTVLLLAMVIMWRSRSDLG